MGMRIVNALVLMLLGISAVSHAGLFDTDPAKRRGFTLSAGYESGTVDIESPQFAIGSESYASFGTWSFGAFINPDWALSFEFRSARYESNEIRRVFLGGAYPTPDVVYATNGLLVEWWGFAPLSLRAGAHLAFYHTDLLVARVEERSDPTEWDDVIGRDNGFGLELGAAIPLVSFRSSAFELRNTFTAGWVDDIDVTNISWSIVYRLY